MKYQTTSGEIVPLNPRKFVQRKKICQRLSNKEGTILELFAGRGYLTEKLYSKYSKKNILVDKENYEDWSRFKDPRYTFYPIDNQKFLQEHLNKLDLSHLSIVDFDAFGTPMPAIQLFFKNFKVTKSFFLTLTDGTPRYVQQNYNNLPNMNKTFRDNGYDFIFKRIDTRLLLKTTTIRTLEGIAKKYDFKINKINYADNDHNTIYMGFRVIP